MYSYIQHTILDGRWVKVSRMGKNWQGWHYGFKLHASIDTKGRLSGVVFTAADVHDIHGMDHILN